MPRTLAEAEARITELETNARNLESALNLWLNCTSWEEGCRRYAVVCELLGWEKPGRKVGKVAAQ
jgi:hypothetical protein